MKCLALVEAVGIENRPYNMQPLMMMMEQMNGDEEGGPH